MKFKGIDYPEPVWGNTIEPKEVTWLWYPYIPAGSATMIFGPGGSGKSHIAVDIASRISKGEPFPGQTTPPLPAQKVLMLSAEDELDRVMVPRLIKAHADLTKIALMNKPITMDGLGLQVLAKYIAQYAVGIVFIDPVVAYIGGKVDINRANETRTFTGGLHQLAMETGTPIVVVHHSRKGQEGMDYERMMGSADFNNAVRSVLYTTQAPNGDRILKHVKANYAPLGPTWRYSFGDKGFQWDGTYEDDDEPETAKGGRKLDAVEWLKRLLSKGPMKSVEVEQAATEANINHRTLTRAKVGVAESSLKAGPTGKMQWWMSLKVQNDEADIPVMDREWGPEKQSRTEREIKAREDARNRPSDAEMGGRGQTVDDIMDKVLGK